MNEQRVREIVREEIEKEKAAAVTATQFLKTDDIKKILTKSLLKGGCK